MKNAVIIYGPPGAGKGTQAHLLEDVFGFLHFDTGRYIESIVHDPALSNDPVVAQERTRFDSGELCSPEWVLNMVREKAEHLAQSGFDQVFSGSPRTIFEAFGDANHEGLMSLFDRLYGRENIHIIHINIKPETSILRNSRRLVCATCGTVLMGTNYSGQTCPICGSPMRRRSLDVPDVIRVRLKEYETRTYPIVSGLQEHGYTVHEVDGEPEPHEVFRNIAALIGKTIHS